MKALFNIKKVQLSPITAIDQKGTPTYSAPLTLPGTVSLTLEGEGTSNVIYADGIGYITTGGAVSYKGTLENYLITEEILTSIFQYVKDTTTKNLFETDKQPKEFGMQFAVDNDEGDEVFFTLYRVSATRPSFNFQTKEAEQQINTQSLELTVTPITLANGSNIIKSFADKTATNTSTYMAKIELPKLTQA